MNIGDIVARLESLANPDNVRGMARFGIRPAKPLGIGMPVLRSLAREIGRDTQLAIELRSTGIHEAKILSSLVFDPKELDEPRMEAMAADFDSWDIVDQTCANLFEKSPLAWKKAVEWAGREEEYVKRAGFTLMARLAVSAKKADDALFLPFLDIIVREAGDDRNAVKKAVNWALRQIGKKNPALRIKALETTDTVRKLGVGCARWIASDAIRELNDPKVVSRLTQRNQRNSCTE